MKQLTNVQILRIIACFGVVFVHIGQVCEIGGVLGLIASWGSNGVYLFFLISGFLAFYSLRLTNRSSKEWFIDRMIKILPLYYIIIIYNMVLHGFILHDVPVDITNLGWLRYIFFLSQVVPTKEVFWSNLSATWTLSCFVVFYVMAIVLRQKLSGYKSALAGMLFSSLFSVFLQRATTWFSVLTALPYFMVGIVVYYAYTKKREKETLGIFIFLIIVLNILQIDLSRPMAITLSLGIILLFTNPIEFGLEKWIRIILDSLDRYSYTVYLVHAVVIELVVEANNRFHLSKIERFVGIVAGIVLFTPIVYHFLELPIQSFLKKRVKSKIL